MPGTAKSIREWALNIRAPLWMTMTAIELAVMASEIGEMYEIVDFDKRMPPIPPAEEWMPYYRNHRLLLREVGAAFGLAVPGMADSGLIVERMQDETRAFVGLSVEDRNKQLAKWGEEAVVTSVKAGIEMQRALFDDTMTQIEETIGGTQTTKG